MKLAVFSVLLAGTISGTASGVKLRFSIDYGDGLVGTYMGTLGDKLNQLVAGTASSNKGGPGVSWTAARK